MGSLNGRIARFGDKKIIFYQLGQYNFITDRNTAHDIFNSEGIGTLTSEKDVMISRNYGKPTIIKDIMFFYTAFTDVLLAMLPDERRNNGKFSSSGRDFCQKLSDRISPFDIIKCNDIDDLEELWLKTNNKNEVMHKKNSQYDESRYYGVNFHSLFSKYGTIEIRWHEGTTNPTMILYWIAIHQHILRKIEEGRLQIHQASNVLGMFKLTDKIEYFFKIVNFPKHLEKYIRERLEFYTLNNN